MVGRICPVGQFASSWSIAAFAIRWYSLAVAMETIWPAKPKILYQALYGESLSTPTLKYKGGKGSCLSCL